jgi:Lipocalin-like domain
MNARWIRIIVILSVAALPGCGKDKGVGPEPSEIYGTWSATKVEYVSKTNPSMRVNLCDSVGGGATLVIESNQNITYILRCTHVAPDTTLGTWKLEGDLFKMYPAGTPWDYTWEITLSGNTLKLEGADMEWDFGGGLEQADQSMFLIR